jgi:serine/threonine-protein kinase
MFLDEARLAARVRHPNVVPTIDVVAEGGLHLVMEYVHGESLAGLIADAAAQGERISPAIAVAVLVGALNGLHAAHEAKNERGEPLEIVHRDVSPRNVLVGADGVARVIDFGVAKATIRMQMTVAGMVKGTLRYMSPEQLRGEPVNRQSDVYSAAVTLWEALTGRRLFDAESEKAVKDAIVLGDVEPPGISTALDNVVMRGLARERSRRFSTAREMALALEACGAASASEVGECVERFAGDALEERARWIAEIERAVISAPRLARARIAGAAFGAGCALAAFAILRAPGTSAYEPHARALLPITAAAAEMVHPFAADAPAQAGPIKRAVRVPHAAHDECNPPYTFDAGGKKVYKRQCL